MSSYRPSELESGPKVGGDQQVFGNATTGQLSDNVVDREDPWEVPTSTVQDTTTSIGEDKTPAGDTPPLPAVTVVDSVANAPETGMHLAPFRRSSRNRHPQSTGYRGAFIRGEKL